MQHANFHITNVSSRAQRAGWILPSTMFLMIFITASLSTSFKILNDNQLTNIATSHAAHLEHIAADFDLFVFNQRDIFLPDLATISAVELTDEQVTEFQNADLRDGFSVLSTPSAPTGPYTLRFFVGLSILDENPLGIILVTPTANNTELKKRMMTQINNSESANSILNAFESQATAELILADAGIEMPANSTAMLSVSLSGLNTSYLLREDRLGPFAAPYGDNFALNLNYYDIINQSELQSINLNTNTLAPIDVASGITTASLASAELDSLKVVGALTVPLICGVNASKSCENVGPDTAALSVTQTSATTLQTQSLYSLNGIFSAPNAHRTTPPANLVLEGTTNADTFIANNGLEAKNDVSTKEFYAAQSDIGTLSSVDILLQGSLNSKDLRQIIILDTLLADESTVDRLTTTVCKGC